MTVALLPRQIVIDPDHPQWLRRHGGKHVFIYGPGDPVERIKKLAQHRGHGIYTPAQHELSF